MNLRTSIHAIGAALLGSTATLQAYDALTRPTELQYWDSTRAQNGYTFFADTQKLVLKIRTPENNWYVADMTRLGDPGEGCIFYMVGEPQQVDAAPPLF